MNIPDNLKYTKDHEWIRVEGNETYVGITDYAQSELGEVVFVEIETEGETLDKEAVFGSVEAVKTVAELMMPISGEVVEVNAALNDNPELVNNDPYGKGWMIKVAVKHVSDLDDLLDAAAYKALLG